MWKIFEGVAVPQMNEVSVQIKESILEILEEALDPDGGRPDFGKALRRLEDIASDGAEEEHAAEQ